MKGLVFTEFFRHVENRHGADLLDDVIERAHLPGGGAYTSVGTYPFTEMVSLVTSLTQVTGEDLPSVLEKFGTHCFERWVDYAPSFFSADRTLFDILENIDEFHETEVRKLYPDAELPSFRKESRTDTKLVLAYHSCKPLSALAMGVIKGAAAHLGETVRTSCEPAHGEGGPYVRIEVERLG